MSDIADIPVSETITALRAVNGLKRGDAIRVLAACLVMIRAESYAIDVLTRLTDELVPKEVDP